MAQEMDNTKCTKAVPVFFLLVGIFTCAVGAGEIGGLMVIISFLSWGLCSMADAANVTQTTITKDTEGKAWPSEDKEPIKFPKVEMRDYTEGISGARPEFFGARAGLKVDPIRRGKWLD